MIVAEYDDRHPDQPMAERPAIGTHGPHITQWYKEREGKNQVNCGKVSEKMKRISETVAQNPPDVTHVFIEFRKFIKEI